MKEKVLILTYYWPPSGGSGVQRWMYFCKYLVEFDIEPFVVTVDPKKASYKFTDESFLNHVKNIHVTHTNTREVLKFYSKLTTGKDNEGIPQGFAGESKPGMLKKIARYVRGNFFIPDARKGWNKFAFKAAAEIIKKNGIQKIITTGPPHSTHLIGLRLKKEFKVKWIADFRDPWRELYYNNLLYRSKRSEKADEGMEQAVIENADLILTIGKGMQKLLQKKTAAEKVKFIYNGYDENVFSGIKQNNFSSDQIIITHLGLLGESQPITTFLLALNKIATENKALFKKIKFRLIGKVSEVIQNEIKTIIPDLVVETIPYVPHQQAMEYIVNSHILLNSLAIVKGEDYLISGKLMEYIASGRPILVLGDSKGNAAELLSNINDCKVIDRGDEKTMTDFLTNLLNEINNGNFCLHPTNELKYTRKNTAKELATIIHRL